MSSWRGLGRDYWLFWAASSLGMGASNILQYVLSLYVLDLTGSATLFASMLSIIIFPRILLTPFAGVLADRMSKSRLMASVLLGEAVVLGAFFLLGEVATIGLVPIYVLVVVLEMGEVLYGSCEAAILPELVDEGQLKDAVSISKVDDGIVQVASPLVAALIYDHLPMALAFAVIGLLDLASALLQGLIRPRHESLRPETGVRPTIWADIREGVDCIRQSAFLRGFIRVMPIANAFVDATFAVSIAYLLRQSFAVDTWVYSAYCSASAVASMVAPLITLPLVRRHAPDRIFFLATLTIACAILLIGLCAVCGLYGLIPALTAVALITAFDCCAVVASIPMQMCASVMLQTSVDKAVLGRVSATLRMVSISSMAVGEMAFGLLNDATWVWLPIFVGSAGMAVSAFLFRKSLGEQGNQSCG